jgi:hypothetical protein
MVTVQYLQYWKTKNAWEYETVLTLSREVGVQPGDVPAFVRELFAQLNTASGRTNHELMSMLVINRSMTVGDRIIIEWPTVYNGPDVRVGDYQVWEVHTTGWAKLTQERAEMVVPPYDL